MLGIALGMVTVSPPPLIAEGRDVRLVAIQRAGVWVEQFFARDASGRFRMILASPGSVAKAEPRDPGAVQGFRRGLYQGVPDFHFTEVKTERSGTGELLTFAVKTAGATFIKRVFVPAEGNRLRVELHADFGVKRTPLHALLMSYAFVPDGNGAKPDSTFLPGFRPRDEQVVGDHFFRAPVACAQKGNLAALLMPDLDVLESGRAMETVIDLDAANGVCDATLLTYGFAAHRLSGHVYYTTDSSLVRNVPGQLLLAADLILDASAEPFGAYGRAVDFQWEKYGHRYFDRIKPQMMPFAEYANVCYPAALTGGRTSIPPHPSSSAQGIAAGESGGLPTESGWFEVEIDGKMCGGIPSGWGYQQGWVSWQAWFNQLRSAWGLRWWGKKLGNSDWVEKADKMLNLALAAPMKGGACPTTYQSREKQWKGSLIMPDSRCYYDLTNMAWKGIWLLRWLEFDDCPRREDIVRQTSDMAMRMARAQNPDGSFPSWLDKDLNPVPVLDHSAQTALPAWFLAEILESYADETAKTRLYTNEVAGLEYKPGIAVRSELGPALLKAADFLAREVVDQQRWYDFETFFSCSPKDCLQRNGKIDDPSMHDRHSLSPPQNTLCMQWAAEALMAVDRLTSTPQPPSPSRAQSSRQGEGGYRRAAMKALNIMALYQNVWPISYRRIAYTFGGFGVQNSDGEYNDARQAQFGCTLADFGALLGRRDLFERGVAATRAAMTLINHPLHEAHGIYPKPNYPLGLQPENCGHGGTDQQNGRTGFDWGEGSGLASMAWLLHKYGETYKHPSGWSVLVDGGSRALDLMAPTQPLEDPVWNFDNWRLPGWMVAGDFAEVPTWSTRMSFGLKPDEGFIGTCEDGQGGFDDRYTGTISSPKFVVSKPKIKLLVGGGSGENVYVELLGPDGKRVYVERGRNRETLDERTWDVSMLRGKALQIRIVDRETGGWGHINVARIRPSD